MTQTWRHLPVAARPIAAAGDAAVAAVRKRDGEAFDQASEALAALDTVQVGLILGTAIRLLLEDAHPDGLDGDDIRAALEHCVRATAAWQPGVDPQVVLILLAGALGVHPEDGGPAPTPQALARHAALLFADLLGPRSPATYLTGALTEIERTQLDD
jgi:hypothetical protein